MQWRAQETPLEAGRLGRRRFLALGGMAAAGALMAACGSDGDGDGGSSTTGAGGDASGLVLVKRFSDSANTPGSVRLPVTLAATDGTVVTAGPATLTGRVVDDGGAEVATFSTPRHAIDEGNPYWPIRVDLAAAGIYQLHVDGTEDATTFQLFDPAAVKTPTTGSPLPPFDTPTADEPRGVDPVCTLTPEPCPFHAKTLTDALASGKPVVYMVGTPAHCQFGTCAPGLEHLVAAASAYPDAVFLHAEVYTDDTATTVAPAVGAVGLDYEPVIYITDAAGLVVDRIDVIWDRAELDEVLARHLV